MEEQRDWLTAAEVAAELKVSAGRVRQWIASGEMPSQLAGGVRLVPRGAVEPFRHRKKTPGPAKRPKRTDPRP